MRIIGYHPHRPQPSNKPRARNRFDSDDTDYAGYTICYTAIYTCVRSALQAMMMHLRATRDECAPIAVALLYAFYWPR